MERETEDAFKRVWRKLDKTEETRVELAKVSQSVKYLAQKVDRFSWAVMTLAVTVVADLISAHLK